MNGVFSAIDETCLEDYRPGYADVMIQHFAAKLDWTEGFTQKVIRDALRFMAISAIPPASPETDGVSEEVRVTVSSPVVDKIVDAIFLDSPLLLWLERNIFHARMVHVPAYAHGETNHTLDNLRYEFTILMMEAAGYELDREKVWPRRLPIAYATCHCGNDLDDCLVYVVH